jgi:tRNA pseudouridine13 synthase
MSSTREREEDEIAEPAAKRTRLESEEDGFQSKTDPTDAKNEAINTAQPSLNVLPPSHALLSAPSHSGSTEGSDLRILETDVGISEYVGHDIPKIEGIIKQRFVKFA